jgi:CheY-like chemotaxis protein
MSQLSQLLLFDPDPSGLDTLIYGFEKDGCSVTGTADPAKALDLIQSANPTLVLVNLRDSEQTGLDLLRATSSNPRTRNLACVAIGREELRPAALAAGAFVFLSVPLFVRDVLGACRLVRAASIPGSRPSPDTEVALKLADLDGMYFVVRAMAVMGRSTAIELRRETKRGELRFIDGTLSSAQLGSVEGLPALHHMLLWEDGELNFKFKNVVRRGSQLSMRSSEVIEECDRFLRDFAHEAKDLGIARTVYAADEAGVQPSDALPSEVVPVLRLFDGHRDLAQVLEESPFRIFDTLKIIKRFVAGEAIRAESQPPTSTVEAGPTWSGPGALNFWLQKQAPVLGPELGQRVENQGPRAPGGGSANSGADPASSGGRPSSPFVAVASGEINVQANSHANSDVSSDMAAVPDQRKRTITQRNVREAAVPLAIEDIDTPPPPVPLLPVVDQQPKPAGAVARGEITILASPARHPESVPMDGSPTVMVEMGALQQTPLPVMTVMPAPMTAESTAESTAKSTELPPSVIVAPMTPAPVVTARPSHPTPTPTSMNSGEPRRHHPRSPTDNFSAVESDFFEREADLYKRESVEDFEDLDGHRTNGPPRKR